MAPVKPMGLSHTENPKTKPGVTGFKQEYNQDPGPRQDLNPDVVADPDVLPKPLPARAAKTSEGKVKRTRKPKAK